MKAFKLYSLKKLVIILLSTKEGQERKKKMNNAIKEKYRGFEEDSKKHSLFNLKGNLYDRNLPNEEVVKYIKKDLKDLYPELKISITQHNHNSYKVKINSDFIINPAHKDEVTKVIKKMFNSFSFDYSDPTTDYFHSGLSATIEFWDLDESTIYLTKHEMENKTVYSGTLRGLTNLKEYLYFMNPKVLIDIVKANGSEFNFVERLELNHLIETKKPRMYKDILEKIKIEKEKHNEIIKTKC